MARDNIAKQIKQQYPNINWDRFEDIDKALNFELWYGTASDYFGEDKAEPLEHYEWKGFVTAEKDIVEILDSLPHELWYDNDADFLADEGYDPENDDRNWLWKCEHCEEYVWMEQNYVDGKLVTTYISDTDVDGCTESEDKLHDVDYTSYNSPEPVWCGGESWEKIDVRKELMFVETWKQVF
jgi:hypothetical protein